jgi:hypothetical protein
MTTTMTLFCVMVIVIGIFLLSLSIISIVTTSYNNYGLFVFAQTTEDKDTNKRTLNTQSVDTFSAIGTISSLVITIPEYKFNITNAFKVVLTGEWNLDVHNGTITNFIANFLVSPMHGSLGHIHQITNFKDNEEKGMIQLTSDNSLSINGTVDFKINGRTIWNDVDILISIPKGSTFSIDSNDKETGNHFGNQQVYGIVTRLIV